MRSPANARASIGRLALFSLLAASCVPGLADQPSAPPLATPDSTAPLATPDNAAQHAGRRVAVEIRVVEVKFAPRRQKHFLSGAANFRSQQNIPVTIAAADLARFEPAADDDLKARYLGKTIRATGILIRDEGQWLLAVSAPDDIVVLPVAASAQPVAELTIVAEDGKRTVMSLPLADDLPRSKLTLDHEGTAEVFEGVALAEVLERAKVPIGAQARGPLLSRYVLVTGQDGYQVLFSVAEIDPYFAREPVLLADRLNGAVLPAARGPLRVVVPADKHRRRWVGQVSSIEVRHAAVSPTANQP